MRIQTTIFMHPVRWSDAAVVQARDELAQLFNSAESVRELLAKAGVDAPANMTGGMRDVWNRVITSVAEQRRDADLVDWILREQPRLRDRLEADPLRLALVPDGEEDRARIDTAVVKHVGTRFADTEQIESLLQHAGVTRIRVAGSGAAAWSAVVLDARAEDALYKVVAQAAYDKPIVRADLLDDLQQTAHRTQASSAWYPEDLPSLKTRFFGPRLATPVIDRNGIRGLLNEIDQKRLKCLIVGGRGRGLSHTFEYLKFHLLTRPAELAVVRINHRIKPTAHGIMTAIADQFVFDVAADSADEQEAATANRMMRALHKGLKGRGGPGIIVLYVPEPEQLSPSAEDLLEDLIAAFGEANFVGYSMIVIGLPSRRWQAPSMRHGALVSYEELRELDASDIKEFYSEVALDTRRHVDDELLATWVADADALLPNVSAVKHHIAQHCSRVFSS